MPDKEFPNGIIAKRNDNAPEFVLCNLSFKVEEFVKYLQDNESKGWVNIDVKRSKWGKIYADKNDWEKKEDSANNAPSTDIDIDSLPF